MKTIIELFDDEPLDNLLGALLTGAEKIVFIGTAKAMSEHNRRGIEHFFAMRKMRPLQEFIHINEYDFPSAVSAVDRVLSENTDCVINLTGGGELEAAALGYAAAKYKVPMITVNCNKRRVIPLSGVYEGDTAFTELTVREYIALYGGSVITHTNFTIDDDFLSDAEYLWNLNRRNPKQWNRMNSHNGLLVNCKSRHSDRLLSKAGNLLEFRTYLAATPIASDIMSGVVVDWDGYRSIYEKDTRNEIDVLMTCGVTPVFISCKNGEVKKEALYELSAVASRFGGKYAKKLLVATGLHGSEDFNGYFRQRAYDMKISLIDNAEELSLEELRSEIKRKTE